MATLTFKQRYLSGFAVFAALFFILGAAPSDSAADRIRHVIDGDTVVLQGGEHVRLIGVNAPEYNLWRNHVQPYGKEAKEYLTRLLEGKKVFIQTDIDKNDKYGRLLAYIWTEDGQMANRLLIQEGMAHARYYRPNGAYRIEFESDERVAAQNQKGLWSPSTQ